MMQLAFFCTAIGASHLPSNVLVDFQAKQKTNTRLEDVFVRVAVKLWAVLSDQGACLVILLPDCTTGKMGISYLIRGC